ncbi:BTB/POZ and TAZ domain-containing protein 4-like [Zingiber officinale]|uniref:BTB/POZ and TAZ domain-containing protein 4 n=1 Tax=Zingiber officinale TaxID=94328 RepID=A0A8J5FFK8_ZINOF|nr:BTB/POZ and TAZ domain-containing protein 4-like [Zingiber officinale]XP_042424272.1 BTB/POZ and TAZ domain-containing protein 4-like [Zingiber officinale]KAG6484508.1 hypothetical protein ZIOFF_053026 [Zingiber officinale]
MEEQRREMSMERCCPQPPPLLGLTTSSKHVEPKMSHGRRSAASGNSNADLLERLFSDGYRADVSVYTNDGIVPAHASILGIVSPVLKSMLRQSKRRGRRAISVRGVPHRAVLVFLRFLYTSSYEQEEMDQFVLHLLVLAHVFMIPSLKEECAKQLEQGLLTAENAVDALQLARLCDAPRLSLLCQRLIVKNFKQVSASGGWKVMRESDHKLANELLDSVKAADTRKSETLRILEERKIYQQLDEAMDALVHICTDGCRTIGPHGKVLRQNAEPCIFPACRGLEALVRHFAGCKNRVLGGCTHCKRMWQLLELHSRLCFLGDGCKVPLCRNFKEKLKHQSKKDELKWKLLVNKVIEVRSFSGTQAHSPTVVL